MANIIKQLVNQLTNGNTFNKVLAIKKALKKRNSYITELNNKEYKKFYRKVKLKQSDNKSDTNSQKIDIFILIFSSVTFIYLQKLKVEKASNIMI